MFVTVLLAFHEIGHSFDPQPIITQFLSGIPEGLLLSVLRSTSGPTIAPQFTASLRYVLSDPTLPLGNATGTIAYDAYLKKYVMSTAGRIPKFGPNASLNSSSLASGSGINATTYSVTNGQCMHMSGAYAQGGFTGLFGWLKMANKTGEDTVEGKTCDKWSYKLPPPNDKYALTACLHGDEPLYFMRATTVMYFEDFHRYADPNQFQVPSACAKTPQPCGSNRIEKKTIYVAHPDANYNISGQDIADAKGDAVFLCTDKMMWTIGDYKLLSAFELSVLDAYSQYTNFPPPGNRGFGGDGYHVGRETPIGLGRHGGQCEDDADLWKSLGVWYSLPRGGQCINDEYQLGVNCTWRIERRVNTITMDCLFHQQAFLEKCNKTAAPFDDVTEALLKSLASEDIAKGGCPSVTTPMCKNHPRCTHLKGDCCPHQDGTMLECCNAHNLANASIVV